MSQNCLSKVRIIFFSHRLPLWNYFQVSEKCAYFLQGVVGVIFKGKHKDCVACCLKYFACVFQCKAVIAENRYKTRGCCLLYADVVTITQTGTGNETLYYKSETRVVPWKPDVLPTSTTTGFPWWEWQLNKKVSKLYRVNFTDHISRNLSN